MSDQTVLLSAQPDQHNDNINTECDDQRSISNIKRCSFCDRPGATHQGGVHTKFGELKGFFCDKKCFDAWLKIHPAIYVWTMERKGNSGEKP